MLPALHIGTMSGDQIIEVLRAGRIANDRPSQEVGKSGGGHYPPPLRPG
jgi:hypothetical protein